MSKPKRSIKVWLICLLCFALGLTGYWGVKKIPWEEETIDLGYSMKAKLNPVLAAEVYLKQVGIPAESHKGLAKLDELSAEQETLIITSWRLSMSKKHMNSLLDWIKKGGHLITTAQSYYDEENAHSADELLDQMGVHMVPNEEDDAPLTQLTPINFEDVENPVWVDFSTASTLVDFSQQAFASAMSDCCVNLLQYEVGRGVITVLTDDTFWHNDNIGNHDHAYFLWLLAKKSGKVWLLYGGKIPSLFALSWKHAPTLVISSLVLFAFWLWYRACRFGPMLPNPPLARRQLMEHIMANGTFLWRHNEMTRLIQNIQNDIERKMQLHHRNYRQLSVSKKQSVLQESTQIPATEIAWTWAMCSGINDLKPGSNKDAQFVRLMQNLQKLRNKL